MSLLVNSVHKVHDRLLATIHIYTKGMEISTERMDLVAEELLNGTSDQMMLLPEGGRVHTRSIVLLTVMESILITKRLRSNLDEDGSITETKLLIQEVLEKLSKQMHKTKEAKELFVNLMRDALTTLDSNHPIALVVTNLGIGQILDEFQFWKGTEQRNTLLQVISLIAETITRKMKHLPRVEFETINTSTQAVCVVCKEKPSDECHLIKFVSQETTEVAFCKDCSIYSRERASDPSIPQAIDLFILIFGKTKGEFQ